MLPTVRYFLMHDGREVGAVRGSAGNWGFGLSHWHGSPPDYSVVRPSHSSWVAMA